ncbi:MAG: phage head closure protein [Betaproteobacteria bacterium]
MRAGALDRRVVIDSAIDTQDATTGEPIRSWGLLATVWASIEPIRGREATIDAGLLAEMDTRITIRYAVALTGLSENDRVRHTVNGIEKIYNIVNIAEVLLEHRSLELMCKSGANDG